MDSAALTSTAHAVRYDLSSFVVLYGRYLVSPVVPAMVIEQTPAVKAMAGYEVCGAMGIMVPAWLLTSWLRGLRRMTSREPFRCTLCSSSGGSSNLAVLSLMALVSTLTAAIYGIYYDNLPNHPRLCLSRYSGGGRAE